MKKFSLVLLLLLTACAGQASALKAEVIAPQATQVFAGSARAANPVDYASTAAVAQTQVITAQEAARQMALQLDAANRLMVDATVTHEAGVMVIAQITQTAAVLSAQYVSASQTAQPTANAARATAQALAIAQTTLQSGQMTAVHEQPTQMAAMNAAETAQKYGWVIVFVQLFTMFSLGLFLLSVASFAFRANVPPPVVKVTRPAVDIVSYGLDPLPAVEAAPAPVKFDPTIIPCSSAQFSELVKGILSDGKTLAINQWEGEGNPFTRGSFQRVRHWLQINQLAKSTGTGSLVLTDSGDSLFIEWLNNNKLTGAYKFKDEGERMKDE